ncbi:MAG: proline--tRNA ligase, partial [Endomicrobia bacterium]|nr:proline--tRNA ligase [Endomicrobiia bacterium]
VWLPHLLPRDIWEESGRWYIYGKELFRLKDRKNADFCLSPTAEEVVTNLIRNELRSYKQLPKMFYQFGVKFRDEIRPRFGIIRAREFYMKDAYSFHKDEQDAENYYEKMVGAYRKIFKRCGLKFVEVEAATGAIGGKYSHEFMVVKEDDTSFVGEETIVICTDCKYSANIEKAACLEDGSILQNGKDLELEEIYTPNIKTVEEVSQFLEHDKKKFIKTLVYLNTEKKEVYLVLVRGDYEINETKLKEALNVSEIELADADIVENLVGVPVGFLGPVKFFLKNSEYSLKIIGDYSIKNIRNAISGANKKNYHIKNINYKRDFKVDIFADIRNITKDDKCPFCKERGKLKFSKGLEVGHTFKLGTKYSESMKATFLDENNQSRFFIMGCYGIGVSRIISAAIEQNYDENGIIWYPEIAPFLVYIVPIDYNDKKIKEMSDNIYDILLANGIETILDDRDERPGVKFKDADLLGIPIRITVSNRLLPDIEIYVRKTYTREIIKIESLISKISSTIEVLKNF